MMHRSAHSVKELPRMDDRFDIEVEQPDVGRAVVVFKGEHERRWMHIPRRRSRWAPNEIVRELVNEVSFDPRPGQPQLRFKKSR
jgi:hypothetical protein